MKQPVNAINRSLVVYQLTPAGLLDAFPNSCYKLASVFEHALNRIP
jgi:hypothetical protein